VGDATRKARRAAAPLGHRHRFGAWRRGLAALACTLVLGLAPATALAQESTAESAGYGVGAALCSLVYSPVKIVYAVAGGLIGGFAWLLSAGDSDVADAVITPAVRGDYVVTPSILRGEKPLEFIGRPPAPSYAPPPPQPESY
jgi:hypothetical protein